MPHNGLISDKIITITQEDHRYKRLDKLITAYCPDLSRSLIQKMFHEGLIAGSQNLELKKIPPAGSQVCIHFPSPRPLGLVAENIPLDIVYEDEHLLIINKQAGMVVHPAPGHHQGTLVNALLFHCKDLKGIGNIMRPGIVHRLDKGTSGIMVVAKDQKTHKGLTTIFSQHNIQREYQALVIGNNIISHGKLESTIGRNPNDRKKMKARVAKGKHALTFFYNIKEYDSYTHLKLKLETGRTHQIRVHLSHLLKHPILGDHMYANINQQLKRLSPELCTILKNYEHPLLHAKSLGFTHPITREKLFFDSELPAIFTPFLLS